MSSRWLGLYGRCLLALYRDCVGIIILKVFDHVGSTRGRSAAQRHEYIDDVDFDWYQSKDEFIADVIWYPLLLFLLAPPTGSTRTA